MRALFRFGKLDRLRFISHLDLQRFMQMALRRTTIQIAYSQGFNPHPVMAFASALAMGWTSEAEILDVKLNQEMTAEYAKAEMQRALPPDMPLYEVKLVEDSHPKMMAILTMADYAIRLGAVGEEPLKRAVDSFLDECSVIALRKTKSGEKPTDVRPMCECIELKQTESGIVLHTRLALTEKSTLKPDLLLSVLSKRMDSIDLMSSARIHRLALLGEDAAGELRPLMER